jgi:Restriction alleviation protein Lar
MSDLKPCPFCEEVDRLTVVENTGGKLFGEGGELVFVLCGGCWARGPYAESKYEAIHAWNNRKV